MLLGDMNAHNSMWSEDNVQTNNHGRLFEQLALNNDVAILNNGSPTHFHVQTGGYSAIDLSICSSEIFDSTQWTVMDDLNGSDHLPIAIEEKDAVPVARERKYILKKANWKLFSQLTTMESENCDELSCNENVEIFNQRLHDAARLSIPMSSGQVMRRRVSWWTNQCTHVTLERKLAQQRYQHTKRICDRIAYHRAHAVAQRTRFLASQTSWKDYLSTINSNG